MDKEILNIHGAAHAYLHFVGYGRGHLVQNEQLQKNTFKNPIRSLYKKKKDGFQEITCEQVGGM